MAMSFIRRREFLMGSGALALSGCATLGRREADVALLGGKVWTQDPRRPEVEAIAIRRGKVLAIGSDAEVEGTIGASTRVVRLDGRRVIPGLNDVHMHPTRGGRFFAAELRWDGVSSLERALDMVAQQARRTPNGQWVRVIGGWSPYQFAERRMPTPEELNKAAPDVPLFVLFLYSGGMLNQAGIDALGLAPQTKAPPGTGYELDASGRLTGRLLATPNPTILYQTIGSLPPLTAEQQAISTRHFYRDLNRLGLTSVIDAGGGGHHVPEDYAGTKALATAGEMPIRVSNYLFPQAKGKELAEFQAWTQSFEVDVNMAEGLDHGYTIRGGGEFLAWAAGDYENFLAERPDITTRNGWDKQLIEVTRHLLANEWPLRIHATYDESMNHIMDVFEEADRLEREAGRKGFAGIRWAFDHGETAMPETLARMKTIGNGGGLATQSRMAYAGEFFVERYGKKMAERAPAFGDALDAGLPVGLGSDATRVSSYNPWNTLYWATTGRSVGGTPLLSARHRLSRAKALELHTVGSAWFSREEAEKGRLSVGQLGDVAVLSHDYLDCGAEQIRRIESLLTVTGGKVVYATGPYEGMAPELPPIEPAWSPVAVFGGYQRG
ncbi:MAG: amidohydrolase [Myxococcota bacterium]